MYKLFLSGVMPLAALVCLWFAVVCLYRGLSMLVRRIRLHLTGLHASSALRRGEGRYVPIFTYVGSRGEELDIMGREEYATEQEALQASRPLVFDAERPDAGMARNAFTYFARPVVLLVLVAVLAEAAHLLLLYTPD